MKNSLKYAFLLLLVLFLFRSWLFEISVNYRPVSAHSTYSVTNPGLQQFLAPEMSLGQVAPNPPDDIEAIIHQALNLTAKRLKFRRAGTENDPNRSFHSQHAHCVGYAAFFATACNFLLEKNGLGNGGQAKHVRGEISFLGIDLHQFSDDPFFRDHDFNVVENVKTGERYLVDASVRDVLGIRFVSR